MVFVLKMLSALCSLICSEEVYGSGDKIKFVFIQCCPKKGHCQRSSQPIINCVRMISDLQSVVCQRLPQIFHLAFQAQSICRVLNML